MNTLLKTPQTDPNHQVVGRLFIGHGRIYYCDSYDPRIGFWMTNVMDASDRRNVSERAPYATFHRIYGVWSPAELSPELSYLLVDLRCAPFTPRSATFQEAKVAQWWQPVFHDGHDAKSASKRALAAFAAMDPKTP